MSEPASWPFGDSAMLGRIRAFDWANTALGPMAQWPPALRLTLTTVLAHPQPMLLAWGPELLTLYNDAYRPLLGDKPEALGRSYLDVWDEAREVLAPQIALAFAGQATQHKDAPFTILSEGKPGRAYFDYSLTPVRDETGTIVGILNTAFETTDRVLADRRHAEATETLHENESHLRALITAGASSIYLMSADWRVLYLLDSDNLASTTQPIDNWIEEYLLEEDRPMVLAAIDQAIRRRSLFELEHRIRLANGQIGWVLSRAIPILNRDGEIVKWFGKGVDVTERKRADAALHESEERLSLAIEIGELASWDWHVPSGKVTWNDRHFLMLGYAVGEVVPSYDSWLARVHPDDRAEAISLIEQARDTRSIYAHEFRALSSHGEIRWCSARGRFFYNEAGQPIRMIGVMEDTTRRKSLETERQQAEESLRASLAEKEALLSEVHHRVKNNLQVITSLLNLQSRGLKDAGVAALFNETRNRVQSIASIHEMLYRSRNFAQIDLLAYTRQLVPALVQFYDAQSRVRVTLEGGETSLELERAVPFGLLLNELISNALKHGLSATETGSLRVDLIRDRETLLLIVKDSGSGLPEGFQPEQIPSLGLRLVLILVKQLEAEIEFKSDAGTLVSVRIPARTGALQDERAQSGTL